ncbi:Sfum_1244 family protein [Thermodesulfobacteriota bacterium]
MSGPRIKHRRNRSLSGSFDNDCKKEGAMLQREALTDQVLQNCTISDSQYAGVYSICGLALRLRDLYKWEKGLDPWVERDSSEVLTWIGDKEEAWDTLTERELNKIEINGSKYDPFDTTGINSALAKDGLFYGAGYALSLKPTFVLADLESKKNIDGYKVYILGRELARDLFTVPALTQDDHVVIRKETARNHLWDHMFYVKESGRRALKFALEHYGLTEQHPGTLHRHLARISAAETETYIYHELGEIQDTVFNRDIWREIIAAFPRTPVELLSRTVKDLLADTNEYGRFQYITRKRKTASLALYVAFYEGLTKVMFPELIEAFQEFMETHNWRVIDQAVSVGYNTAKQYAETICSIYRTGKQKNDKKWAEDEIANRLLKPLGV